MDAERAPREPGIRITLCIATRDRPELVERHLLPCLRRLPAGSSVTIIDQSTTGRTGEHLAGLDGVVYRRANEVGLSRARNLAVRTTTAPLLAFTDDDVVFEPSWLDRLAALFDRFPEAGAVCGHAVTPGGDPIWGAAAAAGVYRWPTSPFGLGAGLNMALRREALVAAGPFDEELGAGARFPAAEDTDMLYRIMRAGWSVVCSGAVAVTHLDWRSHHDELRLHYGYGVGVGAQTAKHVTAGDRVAGWIGLRQVLHRLLLTLPRSLLLLRPRDALRQLTFSSGMAAGFVGWRRAHRRRRASTRASDSRP